MKATGMDVHWDSPGASRLRDRYEVTVHIVCVRVTLDATAPAAPTYPAPPPAGDASPAAPWASSIVEMLIDGIARRLPPA